MPTVSSKKFRSISWRIFWPKFPTPRPSVRFATTFTSGGRCAKHYPLRRQNSRLCLPRGPKFDKVIADLFQQQLLGKGRNPEERTKLLRKLAGIKEPPKKKVKEEKKKPDVKPGKKRVGPAESAAHEARSGPAKASTPSTVTAAHTTAKAAAAAKGASAAAAHQPAKRHSKAHSNRR